ncbi:MAG TPA: hypothetical protein VFQ82_00460 [Stellaceae bacterium]|nr:hypothetical protein [Stellaceae bacterium]
MHASRLVLAGFLCLGAFAAAAKAIPERPRDGAAAPAATVVAAQECPAGYHYEAGHYAKHGKWRDAGCWPN